MLPENLKRILTIPHRFLLILIVSVIIFLFTLLFLLLWIPVFIWRQFVILLTLKLFPKKFGRILTPMDVLSHVQNPVAGAPNASVVCTAVLEKDLTIDQVRELFSKLVLNRTVKHQDNMSILRYPELRQYEVDWLGFRFLKWDNEFNINYHIIELGITPVVSNIAQAHTELLNREFDKRKSPWELVIFRGIGGADDKEGGGSQTLLGLRINHTIADGLSVLKLFVESLGGKRLVKANRSIMEKGTSDKIKFLLKFPFSLGKDTYQFWKDVLLHSLRGGGAPLGLTGAGKLRRVGVGITKKIRMEDVKSLSKLLGVTTSSIIMAGIIGGFGRMVRKAGYKNGISKFPMGYVLPVDGHPVGFANHWRTIYTQVSLDTETSQFSRIRSCNRAFLKMKTGTLGHFFQSSLYFSGTCPTNLAAILMRNRICSFGITNIAGEEEGFFVGGTECMDLCLSTGGLPGIGLMFCVMSYRNNFRVSCVAEENGFMTEGNVNELANLVYQEFQEFFCDYGADNV